MKKARLVSIVLSALMVFYAFPLHGFAVNAGVSESIPSNENIIKEFVPELSEDASSDLSEEDAEPMILYEDEKLRTEDTKHYRMTDGSFTAVKFDDDVHYEKDGEWKEIDNSLVLDPSSTKDKPVYRNFAGNVLFRFEGDPTDGKVSAEYEDYAISFELIDLPEPDVGLQPVPNPGDQVELMANGNVEPEVIGAEIIIEDVPASEAAESVAEESEVSVESETVASEPETEVPMEETTGPDTEAISEPEPIEEEAFETLEPSEPIELDTDKITTVAPETTAVPETTEPESTGLSEPTVSIDPEVNEKLPILQERSFEIEITNPGKESAEIMTFAEATAESKVVTKQEEFTTFTLDQAFESVKSSSLINFTDPTDDFTLSYNLTGNTLKENIIVNTKTDEYTYKFALNTVGLVPALMEDGSVSLNDAEGGSIFTIPAPYMFDAENEYSSNVEYTLTGNTEDGYILTVTADPEWINAQDRLLPVTIDPALILTKYGSTSNTDIDTQYYSTGGGLRPNTGNLYLGYDSSGDYTYSGYFKVNSLPEIPQNCVPVDARIYLGQYAFGGNVSSFKVSAHSATSESGWYSNYDTNALDYVTVSNDTTGKYLVWEVTAAAQDWYTTPSTNLGITLKLVGEMTSTSCSKASLVGYNNAGFGADAQPKFCVQYMNTVGISDLYTYRTQNIGRAGAGYVRDNDGAFTLVKGVLSNTGSAMSFTLSHVYNSANPTVQFTSVNTGLNTCDYSQMLVGRGWKLSIQQTVVKKTIKDINGDNATYLIYTDEDGTERYFYYKEDDKKYYDEETSSLTITEANNGTEHTLSNDKDDKLYFVNGYLHKIEDANENIITVKYGNVANGNKVVGTGTPSSQCNRIVSVTQTIKGEAEKIIATFTYNNAKQLTTVTDEAGRVTTFLYGAADSTGGIYQINHNDGTYALYYYGGLNLRMSRAYDAEAQYGVDYGYNANGFIRKFEEFVCPTGSINSTAYSQKGAKYYIDTAGKKITYVRYLGNDRVSTNADDIVNVYIFDDYGRTINSYSANSKPGDTYAPFKIYGTSVTEYTPTGTTPSKKDNKISADALTGSLALNYLANPGVESNQGTSWTEAPNGGTIYKSGIAHTGTKSYVLCGNNSSNSNTHISQTFALTAGDYTFSAYVRAASITAIGANGGIRLRIVNNSGTVVSESRIITQNSNQSVNEGWERLSATLYVPSTGYYAFYVSVVNTQGTAYVDDLQLEPNEGASRANLVSNGMFEQALTGTWSALNGNVAATSASQAHSGTNALSVTPGMNGSIQVSQTVNINSDGGSESFVLGGWAYAYSVPEKEDDSVKFKLYAKLNYSDGTADFKDIKFNPDIRGEWQYGSKVLVSKSDKTLVSVDVVCYYAANNGTAYFDDISLIHEAVQTYKYNDKGELESVTSSDKAVADAYQYENSNLISSTSSGSGTFQYEYEDPNNDHLVTKVTNDNVANSISYDEAGNSIGSTLANIYDTNYEKISSSTTYTGKNYLSSTTDSNGITTTYTYNGKNQVSGITVPVSNTGIESDTTVKTSYKYDNSDRNSSTYISEKISLNYSYVNGLISQISRGGYIPGQSAAQTQTYSFTYDDFGNRLSTSAGSSTLATYTYDAKNGRLNKMTYGNGDRETYTYDHLDRVIAISYNGTVRYRYRYNGDGALSETHDLLYDYVTYFEYDGIGRLVSQRKYSTYDNSFVEGECYEYDSSGRVKRTINLGKYTDSNASFTYNDADGNITSLYVAHTDVDARFEFTYDYIKRLQTKRFFHHGAPTKTLRVDYGYEDLVADTKTTTRVNNIQYLVEDGTQGYFRRFGYEYDSVGNISKTFTGENENLTRYFYDKQNQLVLEINPYANETYEYIYDTYGNIRQKKIYQGTSFSNYANFTSQKNQYLKDSVNYGYTNSNLKDLMTSYDGHSLTYDAIGNPLSYYGTTGQATLTWKDGRTLSTLVSSSTNVEYLYNEDGQRIKKDFATGDSHYYHYSGGRLVSESWGNKRLEFLYDEADIYGVYYTNGSSSQVYYFIKNLQGDVVEIVDQNMNRIATYTYDAWGRVLSVKNHNSVVITDTNHIGYVNPIRYRGYYYDNETGFYYLQERYYDPEIARWINADVSETLSAEFENFAQYNLFAYCFNNPVNMTDDAGTWPNWLKKTVAAVAVVAVVATAAAICVATAGTGAAVTCALLGAAKGAAVGMVTGAVSGAATGAVSHRLSTGSWEGAGTAALEGMADGALSGAITGAVTGAVKSPYCFVAGTSVLTATGYVAIENISENDVVYAWNEATDEVELKRVVETYINETDELIHLFVNGEEIVTTPSHPFYSPVKGWTDAVHLRAGDQLVLVNGEYVVLEKVQHEILESPVTVYNFQVEDDHTYYVGENAILVHNACKNPGGRHGGQSHRNTVNTVKNNLKSKGWEVAKNESRVYFNATKYRYPDIQATKNGITRYFQIGRTTSLGKPVAREVRALRDLAQTGNSVFFIPYK